MLTKELSFYVILQKWLIFAVNVILFLFGLIQIGFVSYILASDVDLGFASDLLHGHNTISHWILGSGIVIVFISFWACIGARRESKCMLWIYAIIILFMIFGGAMAVGIVTISIKYGDHILGSIWQDLKPEIVSTIEKEYGCCSFNGNSTNTWVYDANQYKANCSAVNETCWEKFEDQIDSNYSMIIIVTSVLLAFQILIYLSTHYVIQSIAEANGIEKALLDQKQFVMTGTFSL